MCSGSVKGRSLVPRDRFGINEHTVSPARYLLILHCIHKNTLGGSLWWTWSLHSHSAIGVSWWLFQADGKYSRTSWCNYIAEGDCLILHATYGIAADSVDDIISLAESTMKEALLRCLGSNIWGHLLLRTPIGWWLWTLQKGSQE
jgi:hypothetical protein